MDERVTTVFLAELELQCRMVVGASGALDEAFYVGNDPGVWYHLQGILVAASNISKMLWGASAAVERRRAPLRALVGVDDTWLIKSRQLRNDFEHFDERLEKWYGERDGGRFYVGRLITNYEGVVVNGEPLPASEQFHTYDPGTKLVTFWDHQMSIPDLVAEINQLGATLEHLREDGKQRPTT